MPLTFNIRHLDHHGLRLVGELPTSELDLERIDAMILAGERLKHDIEVERHERAFFVRGSLELLLRCECVRCLRPFERLLRLSDWTCLLPMEGEEKVLIVNDCVDLTPYVREDIVLAFPQHPSCEVGCSGLIGARLPSDKNSPGGGSTKRATAAWSELDKLKL